MTEKKRRNDWLADASSLLQLVESNVKVMEGVYARERERKVQLNDDGRIAFD